MKKKFLTYNLHTHSKYCDGNQDIIKHCEFSINNGLNVLGFSSHAPLKFNNSFSIPLSKMNEYVLDINNAKEKYCHQIEILKGLECDYIPGLNEPFSKVKEAYNLDYIIGGIHLIGKNDPTDLWFIDGPKRETYDDGLLKFFGNDIKNAIKAYFLQMNEMIETERFDILAHIDKIKMHNQSRFFTEDENWYQLLIEETLDLVKLKDLIVEINYRGIYKNRCSDFYPSLTILKKMHDKKIRICISSDSHQPSEIGLLHSEALEFAKTAGYKETYCLDKAIEISEK